MATMNQQGLVEKLDSRYDPRHGGFKLPQVQPLQTPAPQSTGTPTQQYDPSKSQVPRVNTAESIQPVQGGTPTQQYDPSQSQVPVIGSQVAPRETLAPAEQLSSYVPAKLTETGKGTTYAGQSEEQTLAASQKGLVSMLEQDNPLMQLARKQGARLAESRGLGGSSLRERAAQGAAIESAMPLVQQAGQLASAERQTAQQSTAQSEIAAANRRLSEMQQQYDLAVQSGDNAAARQLQSDISVEANNLAQWQTQSKIASTESIQNAQNQLQDMFQNRQLYSNEQIAQAERDLSQLQQQQQIASTEAIQNAQNQLQDMFQNRQLYSNEQIAQAERDVQSLTQQRDIDFRTKLAEDDRTLQRDMQSIDIDYKKWLEDITFKHQGILQGNVQAAGAYSDFTEAAMNILNNPETSPEQKKASIEALKEALGSSLDVIGTTAGLDLTRFLPAEPITPATPSYMSLTDTITNWWENNQPT